MSSFHSSFCSFIITRIWCTFIKCHHNIRSDVLLNFHGNFRRNKMFCTIFRILKFYTIFGNFSKMSQRKYLKSTRISQNRLIPIHPTVNSTEISNSFCSGSQIKVIRVRQNNLGTGISYLVTS